MKFLIVFLVSWPVMASDNIKIVRDFYDLAFIQGKPLKASQYLSESYIQHNPHVETGKAGFLKAFRSFNPSGYSFDIKRVIASNDLVVLHTHVKKGKENGSAVIDIFKVKEGKIVEHWDVIQKVPRITAHKNTMF